MSRTDGTAVANVMVQVGDVQMCGGQLMVGVSDSAPLGADAPGLLEIVGRYLIQEIDGTETPTPEDEDPAIRDLVDQLIAEGHIRHWFEPQQLVHAPKWMDREMFSNSAQSIYSEDAFDALIRAVVFDDDYFSRIGRHGELPVLDVAALYRLMSDHEFEVRFRSLAGVSNGCVSLLQDMRRVFLRGQ